jgi:hypothetical protein
MSERLAALFEAKRVDDRARRLVAEYRREVFAAPLRWETLFDALVDQMKRLCEPAKACPPDLVAYLAGLGATPPPGRARAR